jgi:hypothetical protein
MGPDLSLWLTWNPGLMTLEISEGKAKAREAAVMRRRMMRSRTAKKVAKRH